jgi:deoxyadenosine/deoxycytidine kinase
MANHNYQPPILVVDGIISAGKTTLIENVVPLLEEKGLKVAVIPECVDEWEKCGILNVFYNDPQRWGYTFQTKAFRDRVTKIKEVYEKRQHEVDLFILERSPSTDRIFMRSMWRAGTVSDLEWELYNQWCSLWSSLTPCKPTHSIYLRTDLDVTMERIKKRNRKGEEKITREYQMNLQDAHDEMFMSSRENEDGEEESLTTLLVVDHQYEDSNGNLDFRALGDRIADLIC